MGFNRLSRLIVDSRGSVIAAIRMDAAPSVTFIAAKAKAQTAARYESDTDQVGSYLVPTKEDFPTLLPSHKNIPGIMLIPGGIVISDGNTVIGAVGISGAPALPDGRVADTVIARKATEVA